MKAFNSLRIGMLGGGQLGRMLLQKAADFSLNIKVLDPDPAAPCRYLCNDFTNGSFQDYDAVYAFGKSCDLVTIEIENVNVQALEALENEGVTVYPQSSVIKTVQDKGLQKIFFRDNKIPTAEFSLFNSKDELIKSSVQFPFIQKLRKGGYDGRGVKKITSSEELSDAFDEPFVMEKMIDFKKEIAVIVARSADGDLKSFPVVDMVFNQEANLVEYLFSPADISIEIENNARKIALKVANDLSIVGLLAVEMFLTSGNELLVNEIAPRPHNSGHHTIEANITSQYEQHLRAILGLPLGNTEMINPSVMINILGEKNYEGIAYYKGIEDVLNTKGAYVHLYGKKFTRPFRKMGHVTVVAESIDAARINAMEIRNTLKVISR
jgi:5-(carboxyamino)imidazole ribonucleotide synthase